MPTVKEPLSAHLLVIALLSLVFFPTIGVRLVDGDEGYYLFAARLVTEGKLLYRDFLYTQMPLLPYIYAAWMKFFGESWLSARLLSALLAVITGFVLYLHALRTFEKRRYAFAACMLYAFSGLVASWYVTVKTYSLSVFCLVSAYTLLFGRWRLTAGRRALIAGLLFGLAVDTRLPVAGTLPAFLLGIHLHVGKGERGRWLLLFLLGFCVALLPNLWFVAQDASNFIFGNIGYHTMREGDGLFLKMRGLLVLFKDVQFAFLFFGGLAWFFLPSGKRGALPASLPVSALLFVICFLPARVFHQYFGVMVPFMILNLLHVAHRLEEEASAGWERSKRPVIAVFTALYLGGSFYASYTANIRTMAGRWELGVIERVAEEVDVQTSPGEPVLTWWPGYLVGTHALVYPRMENHFGQEVAYLMDAEERQRRHIIHPDDIARAIEKGEVRVVVLGNRVPVRLDLCRRCMLKEAGYVLYDRIADVEIYRLER